jgi:hypothetical protein
MASKKISELNSASTLTGAERFLIVQSGDNRQLTLDTLLAGLTTSAAVNPTLTLTTNAFIVKGTGGNTTNGILRIQGNASNLPTLLLSNSTGTKFTFNIGDTATFGGTALTLVESWNNAAQIFNSIDLQITNTSSNVASRVLSVKLGGTQVAAIDFGGNVWSQSNYPRFPSLGFVGTFNGITVNTQSLPLTGTLNLSYAQLSSTSMIYLNQSGNASYDVTLPTTGLSDADSGKVWTFVINQATAFSQTIFPLNAGERGTKYFRYRTAGVIGGYVMQFAWLKISGVGQWYPVTGYPFQTSGSSTAPTQGVLLYDV